MVSDFTLCLYEHPKRLSRVRENRNLVCFSSNFIAKVE